MTYCVLASECCRDYLITDSAETLKDLEMTEGEHIREELWFHACLVAFTVVGVALIIFGTLFLTNVIPPSIFNYSTNLFGLSIQTRMIIIGSILVGVGTLFASCCGSVSSSRYSIGICNVIDGVGAQALGVYQMVRRVRP